MKRRMKMNQNLISKVLAFVAGAGIGSVVTYKVVKTKYNKIIQEEIDSVKQAYKNDKDYGPVEDTSTGNTEKSDTPEMTDEEKEADINRIREVINQNGYAAESTEKETKTMTEPYMISYEEYGEKDYVTMTWHYWEDGTVTNEQNEIIGNASELVGDDFMNHYGENPDDPDVVYVRDDDGQIDYEILREEEPYDEG